MIDKIDPKIIKNELNVLKKIGVQIKQKNSIIINKAKIKKINLITKPYPGFPTDLQARLWFYLTSQRHIRIKENIFENRFMHVPELKRMGAQMK